MRDSGDMLFYIPDDNSNSGSGYSFGFGYWNVMLYVLDESCLMERGVLGLC